jgi:hypothetical protein
MYEICEGVQKSLEHAIRSTLSTLAGEIAGYPPVLKQIAGSPELHANLASAGKDSLVSVAFLDCLASIVDRECINAGIDPLAFPEGSLSVRVVPCPALLSAIDMATAVAIQLVGIDGMLINKEGWKKRGGPSPAKQTPPAEPQD